MASPAKIAVSEPEDEAALVARAAGGDRRAFSHLYRRHARYVAGVVYRLLGGDDELDDLVQETFAEGLHCLEGLRDPEQFRRWITTIAVRRVKRRLADRYRRRDIVDHASVTAPTVSDPAQREDVETLYRALEKISDELRIPWVLHHVQGETLPDVATLCETSLSTVKRRIARAGARLSRRLHAR